MDVYEEGVLINQAAEGPPSHTRDTQHGSDEPTHTRRAHTKAAPNTQMRRGSKPLHVGLHSLVCCTTKTRHNSGSGSSTHYTAVLVERACSAGNPVWKHSLCRLSTSKSGVLALHAEGAVPPSSGHCVPPHTQSASRHSTAQSHVRGTTRHC